MRTSAINSTLCVVFCLGAATAARAQLLNAQFSTPTLDRWNYPFDSAPGYSETAAVFSALGQEDAFPGFSFDQRDSQMVLAWDTGAAVPTGLGVCAYRVVGASLTIGTTGEIPFRYDPTYDPRSTFLVGSTDPDLGRSIELYGAGFRAGWTLGAPGQEGCPVPNGYPCYYEGDIDLPGPPFGPCICKNQRFVFATDFLAGSPRDITNNIRDGFDPVPFAVGQIAGVSAGDYVFTPADVEFEVSVALPDVQRYFREAANSGRLMLSISSLQPAASVGGPGSGEYARFFTKEHPLGVEPGTGDVRWARLSLSVRLVSLVGDLNYDGTVNTSDLVELLARFGQSGTLLESDVNCDEVVNTADLVLLLSNFGRNG